MKVRLILTYLLGVLIFSAGASAATHTLEFLCNTKEEKAFIADIKNCELLGSVSRYADNGKSWKYHFKVSPGASCTVTVKIQGNGSIILTSGNKSVSKAISSKDRLRESQVKFTLPTDSRDLYISIKAKDYIRLQRVNLTWTDKDSNADGISDLVESLLGASKASPMGVMKRPPDPHTSFQTPTPYMPENDIRTDAVIIYSSQKECYDTWKAKGYDTQTMYGFRVGDDYIKKHPEEGQTTADGTILTCGPGSYYMVPTRNRMKAAIDYFREAIKNGSTAVIPEEPEFFQQAGYSGAFKNEWRNFYHEDWQDPASSIEARWKSEQLKGYLEYRMIKAIEDDALAQNPNVKRMVAAHSQISYYSGGIIYPHFKVLNETPLQGMIGQVWTGTARAGTKYQGDFAERTFEWGYLEYSSLYNLMRGTGKELWFLMDPLEDNPDRTMEDYQENYEKTLIGSMMFPPIDKFEVMPWPTRIYGRVPDWFATKIGTIVNMLNDIHNQKTFEAYMGTKGIATFVADSMAWQRGTPFPSDFTAFHGMTLPLIMKGVPVQVAQLERAPEKGYLDPYNVLFLTYDLLKPMSPDYNIALANWVRKGGCLVVFGGTDPYNNLPEWWRSAGYASPLDHLFAQLGIGISGSKPVVSTTQFKPLIAEVNEYHNLENQKVYSIDLSDRVLDDGSIYLKFEDAFKNDGWGPYVTNIELIADGKTICSFKPGTDEEKEYMIDNTGSQVGGSARFADANGYWVYKFNVPKGSKVLLNVDMGNEFMLSTATDKLESMHRLQKVMDNKLTQKLPSIDVPSSNTITTYQADAEPLYRLDGTDLLPAFEKKVGNGSVIFMGIAPQYFSISKESADAMRTIAEYACSKAGITYNETGYLGMRRGKYIAMRTFEKPFQFKGTYIDILDPETGIRVDPIIPVDSRCVLADVSNLIGDDKPRILISSNRIEAKVESEDMTSMLVTGPLKTIGTVRVSTAKRDIKSIDAYDSNGNSVPILHRIENGTVFLKYDSLPEGVVVRIAWR